MVCVCWDMSTNCCYNIFETLLGYYLGWRVHWCKLSFNLKYSHIFIYYNVYQWHCRHRWSHHIALGRLGVRRQEFADDDSTITGMNKEVLWCHVISYYVIGYLTLVALRKHKHIHYTNASQQTRDVRPMWAQCWACVVDDGLTLYQHWVSVSCLLIVWQGTNL